MITTASRVTRSLSAVASANVLDPIPGIGLVELYDLSPLSNSKVGNISTRGSVGTQDNILISSFIIGDVDSATVVVRPLGPTLASFGVSGVLSDPTLTIYDSGGSVIATNDNWQDGNNALDVQRSGLAPPNALESAIVLHLPAGAYTAVVRGANGATGKCLSRGLRPRLALLSDSRVAATRQADTTGFRPSTGAKPINTPRSNVEKFCA